MISISLPLLDHALGILDDLIPDADRRDEVKARVRLAVAAGNREWGPQGVVAAVAGVELVGYLAAVSWGTAFGLFVPLVWEALAVRVALVAALFGLDPKQIPELLKALSKARKA